ncbi:dienelactone hydrolase family protein [candidate division CSSED10-310 bacterium]|uniref:Dienelactone hydrolase family protein n=1 Tax=candidate division CSSED10-310 bacterium TaxID=2855610 RepID=A0ABV6Z2J8_UNCC1
MKIISLVAILSGLILFPLPLMALHDSNQKIELVEITTAAGDKVKVIYCAPQTIDKIPARKRNTMPVVIYNHGLIVQKKGYQGAKKAGYDVADFVRELARNGFIGLAPLRPDRPLPLNDIMAAALKSLPDQTQANRSKIGLIGFSYGGLLTLRAALTFTNLGAVVLMSPALTGQRNDPGLKEIYDHLDKLTVPVMVTLGVSDPPRIKNHVQQILIPHLQKQIKGLELKVDYPGNHAWFWQVRPEYWPDIIAFLGRHLPR